MLRRHLSRRQIVIRMVEDHVARSARPRRMKQAGGIDEGRILFAECREIVGVKPRLVLLRNLARSGAKRTPVNRHLWTMLAFRSHAHPLAQQWMPAQFAHILRTCSATTSSTRIISFTTKASP